MRHAWGFVVVVLLGLALGGCLPREDRGCPACPGAGTASLLLPFETVDHGVHSGVREERRVVVRDEAAWRALWDEHVAGRVPEPPLPSVDFTREMAVAFFLGEKPTSGYGVEIVEIVLGGERLQVRVEVVSPPPGAPVLQVLTQPFHIVKLARFDLPVDFFLVEPSPREPSAR